MLHQSTGGWTLASTLRFFQGEFIMKRFGFLYDQKKCIGCNACQMACKDKNDLEAGIFVTVK